VGLILDSSAVIDAERAGETAYQMVERMGAGEVALAVSVITVFEMAHGVYRANSDKRQRNRQRFLDDLLTGMPVQPVTIAVALRAGQIDGFLQANGERVALADLLIGATALELGYAVATHNVKHFEKIPDLHIRQL
jgi:predicted nucleic acid-binding protein